MTDPTKARLTAPPKLKVKSVPSSLLLRFTRNARQVFDEMKKKTSALQVTSCRTRLKLKKDGVILELIPPPTKVNNLIFGRTWIDSPGEMVLTNLTTGDKVVLYFQPRGWFGVGRYEVDGYVRMYTTQLKNQRY